MKKVMSLLLSVLFIFTSVPAYASDEVISDAPTFETLFQKEEISDPAVLIERAQKGITDKFENAAVERAITGNRASLKNVDTNLSDDLVIYETT